MTLLFRSGLKNLMQYSIMIGKEALRFLFRNILLATLTLLTENTEDFVVVHADFDTIQ